MNLVAALILFLSAWAVQTPKPNASLRGLSVRPMPKGSAYRFSLWASGTNGTVLRSTDDGKKWQPLPAPEALDFRDVEAFDDDTAFIMSSGDQGKSRIYKTNDAGKSWALQYSDPRSAFFLDSLACDSPLHCVAMGDPIDGKFVVLITSDGKEWKELPHPPVAQPGDGAFAASGTAIALCRGQIFFVTGGAIPRMFNSKNNGVTWNFVDLPITHGNASSGAFSIACHDDDLVVVGGDYKNPTQSQQIAAYSHDSGKAWNAAATQPQGFRSAVAWLSNETVIAVGTTGADISHDKGAHWTAIDNSNWNAVAAVEGEAWAVGPQGNVAALDTKSR
jgi:photosystem II stability/assembly factor-like uncharacterized protein